MLKKMIFMMTAIAISALLFGGCKSADFAPHCSVGDVANYKVVQETTKEVSFEQPSLNKSKIDTTQSIVSMTFTQSATELANDGSMLFDINIKAVKIFSKGQKGVNIDYDSQKEADKSNEITKLIGKSYKIKIAPNGKADAVDVADARKASNSREVKALLSDETIADRHSIVAMPEEGEAKISKKSGWSTLGSTPKGALQPKSFEKVYTLGEVKDTPQGKVATIDMLANETNKQVKGLDSAGGLGVMANIFDSTSTYTGKLEYNVTTGKILSYSENLISEHVAAEEPRGGDPAKGPDVLTMRFISTYSIEEVE